MSSAAAVLRELASAGISPMLTPDGTGIAVPAGRLTDTQRATILMHKGALLACLRTIAAAMRACDAHGDDEAAREAMRADVLATPPELRDDLLAYFIGTYGPPAPAQAPAPTPAPKPQADPVWKGLHATYMQHVSTCATCIAAGKGYGLRCGAGTALWTAYTAAAQN